MFLMMVHNLFGFASCCLYKAANIGMRVVDDFFVSSIAFVEMCNLGDAIVSLQVTLRTSHRIGLGVVYGFHVCAPLSLCLVPYDV